MNKYYAQQLRVFDVLVCLWQIVAVKLRTGLSSVTGI